MKAVVRDRYGSPDVLELVEIDEPEPGDGEVLVRVRAASLNTADLDYLRGLPHVARLGTGLRRPKNRGLGLDVAGQVESVGAGVTRLQPGDEVWADLTEHGHGAFAEYVCAAEDAFAPKPDGSTFEEAATVPQSAVMALQGLRVRGGVQPGDNVLINGAGGCVGPFAVQIAKAFGAEVTGVDHGGKLDLLRAVGADHVIDHTRQDVTRNGFRYDRILDIASSRSVLDFRRSLAPEGTYVLIAHSIGRFLEVVTVGRLVRSRRRRIGAFPWRPNDRDDLAFLGSLLEAGAVRPPIDRRYALTEVPEALRFLEAGRARGKVVITV